MNDKDIWTCRAAILRIINLRKAEDRQAALAQYTEPLRGVIQRGVEKVMPSRLERWRKEDEDRARRMARREKQ